MLVVIAVATIGNAQQVRDGMGAVLRSPMLISAVLIGYGSAFVLRSVAWKILLPSMSLTRSVSILHASLLANHLAPIKAGEVLRPYLAIRQGVDAPSAISTTIVARVMDLMSLVFLTSVLAPSLLWKQLTTPSTVAFAMVCGAGLIGSLVIFQLRNSVLSTVTLRIREISLSILRTPKKQLLSAALVTLPSWILEASVLLVAAQSLGTELTIQAAIAATAFTLIFQVVHITPGGVGVYEASMTAALAALGVPVNDALTIAIVAHALKFTYSFTVGTAFASIEARDSKLMPGQPLFGRPVVAVPFLAQLAVIIAFFLGGLSWTESIIAEVVLAVTAMALLLARQWAGSWRPLRPLSPIQPTSDRPVVVLIPAYNEADSLPGVLARIPKDMAHLRVIVVDDGSTDDTVSIASSYGAEVVRHKANLGLGAALRSGLRRASDIAPSAVVYLDADGEYDPSDISVVLAPVLAGYADYVLGSRRIKADRRALTRRIGNPIFTILLSLVAGRHVVDAQTGFRAFSRRAAERAEIVHDYNYAQVLTLDLLRKRMRMSQVEVNWSQRKTGESFIRLNYLWKVPLGMVRELISD